MIFIVKFVLKFYFIFLVWVFIIIYLEFRNVYNGFGFYFIF